MIANRNARTATAADGERALRADPEAARRRRVTSGIAAVLGTAMLVLGALQMVRGGGVATLIAVTTGILAWALSFAARRRVATPIVANLVLLLLAFLLTGGAFMRGGAGSPAAMALGLVPMLAVLLVGRWGAIGWCVGVAAANVLLGVATSRAPLVDLVELPLRPLVGASASTVLAVTLLAIGLVYEKRRLLALEEVLRRDHALRAVDRERIAAEAEAKVLRAEHLASIGRLAAGAAHEINNPLSYVLYNLEALEEHLDGRTTLERAETLELAREALTGARHIQKVVRDLKTYSRAETDSVEAVDLHAVIESVLQMADNETRHRAKVVRDYGDVPPVLASRARVGRILLNLVINAAQAIPEGRAHENEITIRTRVDPDDEGQVAVEVRDSGSGIEPDVLRHVTEPFFTTKPVGAGTGLGLTASVNLVDRLGGTFDIRSEVGRGTTMRFTLPRAAAARSISSPPPPPPPATPTPARSGVRLLIVDDDASVRRALQRLLRGHETVTARNGTEALELLRRDDGFDLVLCDLMMPEMTGMDVYRTLAEEKPHLAERVVLMSGGAFSEGSRDFLAGFPGRLLDKPFSADALLELVATAAKQTAKSA